MSFIILILIITAIFYIKKNNKSNKTSENNRNILKNNNINNAEKNKKEYLIKKIIIFLVCFNVGIFLFNNIVKNTEYKRSEEYKIKELQSKVDKGIVNNKNNKYIVNNEEYYQKGIDFYKNNLIPTSELWERQSSVPYLVLSLLEKENKEDYSNWLDYNYGGIKMIREETYNNLYNLKKTSKNSEIIACEQEILDFIDNVIKNYGRCYKICKKDEDKYYALIGKKIYLSGEKEQDKLKIDSSVEYSFSNKNGRGRSDNGREEPFYVGDIGYVVVSNMDKFTDLPWKIDTYIKDKQFYKKIGNIEHKTKVRVKEQSLTHEGYGVYSGYLLVEDLKNREKFIINVANFMTKDYWNNIDLEEISSLGYSIVEFNQVSNYYPVNNKNEKEELKNGTKLLLVGKTGSYTSGINKKTNQLEVKVFTKDNVEKSIFVNKDDIKLVY